MGEPFINLFVYGCTQTNFVFGTRFATLGSNTSGKAIDCIASG